MADTVPIGLITCSPGAISFRAIDAVAFGTSYLADAARICADAARIRLCATGASLPVAMEGDYHRLERACLKALPAGAFGRPLLVNLEGLIAHRPSAEPGRGPLTCTLMLFKATPSALFPSALVQCTGSDRLNPQRCTTWL